MDLRSLIIGRALKRYMIISTQQEPQATVMEPFKSLCGSTAYFDMGRALAWAKAGGW